MNHRKLVTTYLEALCLSGILVISTSLLAAEDDTLLLQLSGDEEMISIATGTPKPISKAPAVATVITAAEIHNSGAATLIQVFERIPGLHTQFSSSRNQSPNYIIRGISTIQNPHVLFMINGERITYLQTANLQQGLQFPIEGISRIEVIRGPGSAVYGADAFAGVINIITKTDKEIKGWLAGSKGGSFGTRHLWGQYGGQHQDWHLSANIEYSDSTGDQGRIINQDAQTTLDGFLGTDVSHAPGPLNSRYESLVTNFMLSNKTWTLHLNSLHGEAGANAGTVNALDPTGYNEYNQFLFDVSHNNSHWLPGWEIKTTFSHYYNDNFSNLTFFPAGAVLPIGTDGNAFTSPLGGLVLFTEGAIAKIGRTDKTSKLEMTALYRGLKKQLWRLNTGIRHEAFEGRARQNAGPGVIDGSISPIDGTLTTTTNTPTIFLPDSRRTITYISAQNEWSFARDWQLIAGLRYDHYSDFGNTTNPRASLIWDTQHNLTTKLLYGRAFRAPSFAELYARNNPISLGNPDLDPETIDTLELVFDYKPNSRLALNFNLFHYRINGLIDFVPNGNELVADNTRDQKSSGFELEANWQAARTLRLFGSVALHNAEDANTGEKVADAPRKQFHLGGHWRIANKWSTQLDVFRIMDRPRATGDTRAEVKDYTWVNLVLNADKVFKDVDVQLTIRNLTDADAREPGPTSIANDYPLEGRGVFLGVSVDL